MSFPTYGNYISGRRAYRSGESCIAAGPKGEKGDSGGQKGEKGQKGLKGQKGDKGLKGEIGIQGVTGDKGATGTVLGGVGMLDTWFVTPTIQASGDNTNELITFSQTTDAWLGKIIGTGNQMVWDGTNKYFSFPKTGIYILDCTFQIRFDSSDGTQPNDSYVAIEYSSNAGTNWLTIAKIYGEKGGQNMPTQLTHTFSANRTINVDDTSNVLVRFNYYEGNGDFASLVQSGNGNSWVTFTRAGLPGEKGAKGAQGATGTVLGGVGMLDMLHVTSSTITADTDNVEYTQTPETIAGTGATYGVVRDSVNRMFYQSGTTVGDGHGLRFPQTGVYTIESTHRFRSNLTYTNASHYISVQMSNDTSTTWETIKEITAFTNLNQQESTSQLFHTLHGKTTVRITNTTTDRIRFKYNSGNQGGSTTNALIGGNSRHSYIIITRAGLPGEKGAKGEKGEKGQKGDKGQKGNQPTGYGGTGSYTFASKLTGDPTAASLWDSNSAPDNTSITFNNLGTGSGNTFANCEFIRVGAYAGVDIPNTKKYHFPDISSSNIMTIAGSRAGHNFPFGYVIPADGDLLGFSIDFIEDTQGKSEFYIVVYNATSSQADCRGIIGGTNEDFASAHIFDVENTNRDRVKEGDYLFAVCRQDGSPNPGNSTGYVHITAYIRFDA